MRLNCAQTKTDFGTEYKFTDTFGAVASTINAPAVGNWHDVFMDFSSHGPMEMYFKPEDTCFDENPRFARQPFYVYRQREYVGRFLGSLRKRRMPFSRAYPYYDLTFDGEFYEMYAIDVAGDGLYLQIVCGDETVAMVRRNNVLTDFKTGYDLALASEKALPLAASALVYYDIMAFETAKEEPASRKADKPGAQKALQKKFDRAFWGKN